MKGKNERTTIEVDKEIKKDLSKYCEKVGKIQYRVVNEAIKRYLEEKNGEGSKMKMRDDSDA